MPAPSFAAPGGSPNTSPPTFGDEKPKRKDAASEEFVTVAGVPIVDEHEDLSAEELQEIVDNSNRRIADTGDASPIIFGEGHTSDFEGSDRPVAGFADNFRLGTLGRLDPRPCVIADLHVRSDLYEESKQYPRRSVELWKDPDEGCWVDSIALLGGTTPKRALGMAFSKNDAASKSGGSKSFRYELIEEPETMATDISKDDQDKFNLMLEASPIGKLLRKQLEADDEEQTVDDETKADEEKHAMEDEECDDKMAKPSKMSKLDRLKLERDDARLELSRYQREVEAQQAQLNDLARKFRKQERHGDLERLKFEGYSFDLADEVEYTLDMSDAAYGKHVSKIKSCYAKAPIGYSPVPTASIEEARGGASESQRAERSAKAVKYAMKHACSFGEALEKVSK